MSKEIKIYGLVCPIELRIVYVGKTNNSLKKRLSQHLCIRERDKSPKKEWILKLKGQLKTPDIVLLEICDLKDWKKTEQKWISHFGLDNLLNYNKGGAGGKESNNYYLNLFVNFLEASGYSKSTIINYKSVIKNFLLFAKTNWHPKTINKKVILDYLNTIENKTKKKCVLIAIKCFFVNIAKQPKKVKYIQYEY